VAQVIIGGQQKPSIRVQLDPAKLVAKVLSLEDIRSQIALTTVDSPKGNIDGERRAYTIYANDQLLDADKWNDVVIAYRNGGPLRIGDIGRAVTGPEDAKQAAWANGQRGVFLVVFKQPGANVIETVDKIKSLLPRLVAAIPPAIKIQIISDRTQTIRAAVEDVQFTLALTILLVVMVIFEDDHDHEHDGQQQRELDVLDRCADGRGAVGDDFDLDRRRDRSHQPRQQRFDLVDGLDDVGARLFVDHQ